MTIKLCGIELDYNRVEKRYNDGERYIITYRSVYEITCNKGKFSARKVYYHNGYVPLTHRGRFHFGNGAWVNRLAEAEIVKGAH